jgi:TolB protein
MKKPFAGLILALFVFTLINCTMEKVPNYGIFDQSTDIGAVKHKGAAAWDSITEQYTLTGSGTNMWFDNDEFHFIWTKVEGDFILYSMLN